MHLFDQIHVELFMASDLDNDNDLFFKNSDKEVIDESENVSTSCFSGSHSFTIHILFSHLIIKSFM